MIRFAKCFCILICVAAWNSAGAAETVKVYILAGQSNMEGHAHVRTFPHLGMDPETKPLLEMMQYGEGKPRVAERVWLVGILSAGGGASASPSSATSSSIAPPAGG